MLVVLMLAGVGLVGAQIQVPHGPVPTPGSGYAPQAAPLYGPPPAPVQGTPQPLRQGPAHPQKGGSNRRSENLFFSSTPYDPFFSNGFPVTAGFHSNPGFHVAAGYPGFFASPFGLSPQQNGDGSWNFVALPIPLENQTIPEGFPSDQVAQAKLWGPIYKEGQGWVYGEAGTILVPKYPPYAPPRYVTPAALQPPSAPSPPPAAEDKGPLAEGTTEVDTKTGKALNVRSASSSKRVERLRKKEPRK